MYLIWQLTRRRRPGEAFRYAIPVSVVVWSLVEVGAFFGMYPEYWQAPAEHPFAMTLMLAVFVTSILTLLRGDPVRAD